MSAGKERNPSTPLNHVTIKRPFEQWGIDMIGEINMHSSLQHKYILIAIDYFTKWVESIPLTQINEKVLYGFH